MPPFRTIRPAALAAALLVAPATAQAPGPCTQPNLPPDARCTTIAVPENRDAPGGRQLSLNVVVLPARTPGTAREAVAFLGGGPGQAASQLAGFSGTRFAALRDTRDLLFVDQRGTGRSTPLQCDLRDPATPQTYLDQYLDPAGAAACRDSLSRVADLARYGYPELSHDMEAVRRALGYGPLDLWGGSYGTRAALAYLRMYPGSVRSVVLHALVPPSFAQPADYARDMDAALAGLFAECRADAACDAAFPDVERELRTVVARLDAAPGEGEIMDTGTGRRVPLSLGRGMFAETVRRMMYAPPLAGLVPFVVHRAYEGDFRPVIRQALADRRGFAEGMFHGLFLAITCAEDLPRVDVAAAARDNGRTVLGDYRVRQQAAGCAGWPRYPLPADYFEPVRSGVPALLISGALDPVTPPRWGEAAAAALPNGLHVVVPHAGHGYDGLLGAGCVDSLIVRFVRAGSARGLDTSCLGGIRRPPFVTEMPEAVAVDPAALERLAGGYASTQPPFEVRVEPLDGALRVRGGNLNAIASPLSPTRFFLEGFPPGFELEFSSDGATVTLRGGGPPLVLTRKP